MKILQLVSDWKWTGPAEPMLVLMAALRRRGHAVALVCPEPPPGANRSLAGEARRRGLGPIAAVEAERSAWRPGDGARSRRLAGMLADEALGGPFDVVHTWHTRDHVLAARALARGPFAGLLHPKPPESPRPAPRLVRSWPRAEAIAAWPWNRWLFGPAACDGLLCVSEGAAAAQRAVRPVGAIAGTPGGVDLAGLVASVAGLAASGRSARQVLGVPEEALLIGVVARMQPQRRFDLLLLALAQLVPRHPEVRLVIFGRGTRAAEVVGEPMVALGLERHVVLAGHRGEDYAALLAAMDVFAYLVPGSDGSCRALREAAALGLPAVATRRGAIPEIVVDGETGLLVDEDPVSLAAALSRLIRAPEQRRAMGESARRRAAEQYAPERFGAFVEAFYAELLRSAPISSR